MFCGVWDRLFRTTVCKSADRLIVSHGRGALAMARHAARASHEQCRTDFWSRVARELEKRSTYRPF